MAQRQVARGLLSQPPPAGQLDNRGRKQFEKLRSTQAQGGQLDPRQQARMNTLQQQRQKPMAMTPRPAPSPAPTQSAPVQSSKPVSSMFGGMNPDPNRLVEGGGNGQGAWEPMGSSAGNQPFPRPSGTYPGMSPQVGGAAGSFGAPSVPGSGDSNVTIPNNGPTNPLTMKRMIGPKVGMNQGSNLAGSRSEGWGQFAKKPQGVY